MNKTFTKFKLAPFSLACLLMLVGMRSAIAQSTNPAPYCAVTHANMGTLGSCANNWGFHFIKWKLNNIDMNISCTSSGAPYRYYNAGPTTTLSPGATYTISMQVGSVSYAMSAAAWIDYNQNNSFETNEFLPSTSPAPVFNPPNATFTYTFTVPCTAKPGLTRLRMRCDYASGMANTYGCNNTLNNYGETLDANVTIAAAGNPKADFFIPDTLFANAPANFLNANQTGYIAHKWYTSVAGLTTQVGSNTNFAFAFPSAGNYQVRLSSTNCGGTSTITKNVTVVNPTSAPGVRFVASRNYIAIAANDLVIDEIVDFYDFSTQGPTSFQWEVIPDPSVKLWFELSPLTGKNTTIFFTDTGRYDVCLTAANSIGSTKVCKSEYLIIEYPQNASKYENVMCADLKSGRDSGIVYDPGGKDNAYPNTSGTCRFTIDVCEANEIDITVMPTNFLISFNDYLRIYDGDITGKQLGAWGNNVTPALPINLKATSGKVTVEFQSDAANNGNGFEVRWKANKVNDGPLDADFKINKTRNDSIYECLSGTVVSFSDMTKGSKKVTKRQWIFNYDPSISYPPGFEDFPDNGDMVNPTYTYTSAQKYNVRLIATSCEGNDTVIKTFHVATTSMTPNVDFTTDQNVIDVGGSTFIRNTSVASCSGVWSITPATYSLQGGTTLTDDVINVKFNAAGRYTVKYTATNDNGSASRTKTDFIKVIEFCNPGVTTPLSSISITNVEFATINKASLLGTGGYEKNLDVTANVFIGEKYPLTITRNTTSDLTDLRVWIDFDRDGVFTSAELIAQNNNSTADVFNTTVAIPDLSVLTPGPTRMRVAIALSGKPVNPCGPLDAGEFEDYALNIMLDNLAPVINMAGSDSVYIEVNTPYSDAGATAFDNREGDITSRLNTVNQVDNTQPGIYLVTYNVSDGSGVPALQRTRFVFVVADLTAPVLTVNGGASITHEAGTVYTDAGATATDNPGSKNVSHLIITNNMVNPSMLGDFDVVYTVTDAYGNTATATRKVKVQDTKAPVINLVGGDPYKIQVGTTFADPTTATDAFWGDVNAMVVAGSVNTSVFGQYKVTYTATDGSGNTSAPVTRTYIVTDLIPPTVSSFSGTQYMVVDANDHNFVEPPVTATDNYFPSVNITRNAGGFDISKLGTYNITYTATDGAGNVTVWVRTINVVDRVKPTVMSNPVNMMRWHAFDPNAGVSTTDNYYPPSDFINKLNGCKIEVISSNVNTLAEGLYQVIYQAVDGSGNVSDPHMRLVAVTANTTGVGELTLDNAVSIYPNPNSGKFDIEIGIPMADNGTIKVVSITGQNIREFGANELVNGKLSVNLADVSAGVYFVQIQSEGQVINKKVTISR